MTAICTVLLADVLELVDVAVCQDKKQVHAKASASRSETRSSRDHTSPSPFVSRACHDPHRDRMTIPENTSFEWNGLFAQLVKGYLHGSY